MSGYTPIFASLTTGTLCGKWPDIGLWPIVLSLADRHGVVDVTPMYLSGVTGLPTQDVIDCMKRFCEPDPYSRSETSGGSRLQLIDEHRDWGWHIVNHAKYREKARLASKDAKRTESGADAERKRAERENVPRCPPVSPSQTQTHTQTDTETQSKNPTARNAPCEPAEFLDFKIAYPNRAGDQGWRKAVRAANARIAEGCTWLEMVAGAQRYAEFVRSTGTEGTEYVKQACTFLGPDLHFRQPWDTPRNKTEVHRDKNIENSQEWLHAS